MVHSKQSWRTVSSASRRGQRGGRETSIPDAETPALNHEQLRMRKWLSQVRFKKAIVGGVDEADVWKKIGELNAIYEAAISAERARYDALLAAQTGQPASVRQSVQTEQPVQERQSAPAGRPVKTGVAAADETVYQGGTGEGRQ